MPEKAAPGASTVPRHDGAGCHILLADDDHWVAEIYARILEVDGFTVHRVEDGAAALERLAARTFDAVISDIEMPGASGIDVLRAAHALDPELPVLLMTGNAGLPAAAEAVEHGALRYLSKPVDLDELVLTLRGALSPQQLARLVPLRRG
jgi:two-component system, NtrC family, response regulator HydG